MTGNTALQPVLFVGHGNPMNAIETTRYTTAWKQMASALPRPRAILCISAHWETDGARVTAMENPHTIHDFYGFPEILYRVHYQAPGAPELARQITALTGGEVVADHDWGLDHGTWSVLRRLYPVADVPVLQLSLDRLRTPAEQVVLARFLAPLRRSGVLIVGSGNLVHNLGMVRWNAPAPYPWAEAFDALVTEMIVAEDLDALVDYPALPDATLAIPTREHYLPLLYALALREPQEPVTFFAEGIDLGSISMRSCRIG